MYVCIVFIFIFRDRPLYSNSFSGRCANKRNYMMDSRLITAVFLKISNLSIPICQGLCWAGYRAETTGTLNLFIFLFFFAFIHFILGVN